MLRKFLIGSMIGAVSTLAILLSVALLIGIVAAVGEWESFSIGFGPVQLMDHKSYESGFSFETGPGLVILSILGGLLNGLGVLYFTSRFSPLRRDAN